MSQNLSSTVVIGALRVINKAPTVFVFGLCVAVQQTLTLFIIFELLVQERCYLGLHFSSLTCVTVLWSLSKTHLS